MLGNVIFSALGFADIIIISRFLGVESAGFYNIAVAISMIISPLIFAANLSLPVIAACRERGDRQGIILLVNRVFMIWCFIFWCGAIFFMLFAKDIIVLFFSKNFITAAPALIVFGPGVLIQVIMLFFYGVLNGAGELKKANILLPAGLAVNILTTLIAIRFIGITGAACGTAAGYLAISAVYFAILRRKLGNISFPLLYFLVGILFYSGAFFLLRQAALPVRCIVFPLLALLLALPPILSLRKPVK